MGFLEKPAVPGGQANPRLATMRPTVRWLENVASIVQASGGPKTRINRI